MSGFSFSSSSSSQRVVKSARSHNDVRTGDVILSDDVGDVGGMHIRHYQVYRGMSPNTSNRLEIRIKELESSLEAEREARVRWEKECSELSFTLEGFTERLEEAEGISSAQLESSRRKEQELAKVRKDLELLSVQHESAEATQRKRHQEALNELNEQLERAKRDKQKSDAARQQLTADLDSCSAALDATTKAKITAESRVSELEEHLRRSQIQLEEILRQSQDFNALKARLLAENQDLHRQLKDLDSNCGGLVKTKSMLQLQLDEATANLEEENGARNQLSIQVNNLQIDVDNLSASLDEQSDLAASLRAQLQRAQVDYQQLKTKYDSDVISIAQELEETRRKFASRITELEGIAEQARGRAAKLEKEKLKIQIELKDAITEFEVMNANAGELNGRLKQADHAVLELRARNQELQNELQRSSADNQRLQNELSQLRAAFEDLQKKIDGLQRDNRQLSETAREAQSHAKDVTRQLHELQALRIELESERNILADQVGELQEGLAGAQGRLDVSTATLLQLKSDMEARLREKDSEIDVIRSSSQRSVEELQRVLAESESKYKVEISKLKRKLEVDSEEYESQLEGLNRTNAELSKANRTLSIRIKDVEVALDEERHRSVDAQQAALALERRRVLLQTELNDVRSLVDNAEKARKQSAAELTDALARVDELSRGLAAAVADRRAVDAERASLRADMDELVAGRRAAEERADRLQAELARLGEELRAEQDSLRQVDAHRRQLEGEARDLAARLEQAELYAAREGKRVIGKLQARLLEVENEYNAEQRRGRDVTAENRRLQKLVAELRAQSEEDRRSVEEQNQHNGALLLRVKSLKRQLEEAEEVVAITMNKYRKAHQLLEECEQHKAETSSQTQTTRSSVQQGSGGRQSNKSMSVVREVTRVVRV